MRCFLKRKKINPYTGQPYVINPRLSPHNMYTLQNILHEGNYQYGILYDLPTKVPGTYKTVELVIKLSFLGRVRCGYHVYSLRISLKFDLYSEESSFDYFDIPEEYIPYYFMIWIASFHDHFKGVSLRNERFIQIRQEFLQEIENRPIVDGKPAEHSRLDQDRFLHFSLSLDKTNSIPWLGHVRENDDAMRLIYRHTGSFSEKMKRWCAHS